MPRVLEENRMFSSKEATSKMTLVGHNMRKRFVNKS